jgi:o-succinylbenzoate---CoA ligase
MNSKTIIVVNNKHIAVDSAQPATLNSAFEKETVSFIKRWLVGEPSFTLQTSGSTGNPKEITLTRQQLAESANRTINKLRLTAKNTALVCLDTKYIAGKMMLVRALEANMKIVVVEPAADPLKDLTVQADFGAFVPLQLDEIFKHPSSLEKLNRFQSIIIGGAAVNIALLEKIKTLSCDVYATYGMTETVSHIALQKINGSDAQDSFEVFPDITVGTDGRDCLTIDMPGAYKPLVTNDVVKLVDARHFQVLGRYDNIINSGGIKLIPEIIERKIETIIHVPFFATGIADHRLGQKLVLVIEGTAQPSLNTVLRQTLPPYEVPKDVLYVDEFVRTETHKINRPKTLEKALKSRA